ncbi:MAG TPA: helix-turn-helix domain-containing protein [Bacillota bacterium]|nr:helix-turn-helix domain-containing protein [Bacillota bacterium]
MKDQPQINLEAADLEELADIICKRVSNPITIEDSNHRLIAYSKHGNWTDKARMETIMGRSVPEAVLNRLWQDGVIQKLMESDQPIRIEAKNEVGLGDRVAISIRKGVSVLGYIYVQEVNEPLGDEEMDYLRQAAHAAMPKLHRRLTRRRLQDEKGKEFFWELLLGHIKSHHEIQIRAEFIHLKLPHPFSVFIFDVEDDRYDQVQKELAFLLSNLSETFSINQFPLWVTNQKQFILLGGGGREKVDFHDRCHAFVQEVIGKIQERFGPLAMTGVFGNEYESFSYIEKSYQQALNVLHMKRILPQEMGAIRGYTDLGIYRLLPTFIEKNADEMYVNRRLERLVRYDEENQSQLLSTLETYLDCAGHVNIASKILHIHPNTLAYRLRRVGEVAGFDLDDPNQRISMFIDLKLRKISK